MSGARIYFNYSSLAQAAYSTLTSGMTGAPLLNALTNTGGARMAPRQAEQFADVFAVLDQRPNTGNGFSATVFQNKASGELVLAIRGSENFFRKDMQGLVDWVHTDLLQLGKSGVPIDQAIDLFNYLQELTATRGQIVYQYGYDHATRTAGYSHTIAQKDGVLAGRTFTVTGHSLGGNLAIVMTRLAPEQVVAAYTYNAPGFDPTVITGPIPGVDDFFSELRRAQIRATNGSNIASAFDLGKLTNLVVPEDLVHVIGSVPGGQIAQFSEGGLPIADHSIVGMTDALAVYSFLSLLDTSKSTSELLTAGLNIMRAASNTSDDSLETIVNALIDLLQMGVPVPTGDRGQLYLSLDGLTSAIVDPNTGGPKPEFQGMRLIDATVLGSAELTAAAMAEGDVGLAFRYALRKLNPFVLLGPASLYEEHNANGELELYSVDDDSGLTERWFEKRAELLGALVRYNQADRKDRVAPGEVSYHDAETNLNLRPFASTRGIAFGASGRLLSARALAVEADLFGTSGDDTILGAPGDSYVDADAGNDVIRTDAGSDEIHAGAGKDSVQTGGGADLIVGGKGDDKPLRGGSDADRIWGDEQQEGESAARYAGANYGGADELYGEGGDDFLYGGGGNDRLEGGQGADQLFGDGLDPDDTERRGDDIIVGGEGADTIYGGEGDDKIYGDDESVNGSTAGESDTIRGGKGDDEIYAGGGDDFDVDGEAGKDVIVGGHGRDFLRGGDGDDEIYGGLKDPDDTRDQGGDQLEGGEGDDRLFGGNGIDFLYGDAGDDELRGGSGNDRLQDGKGHDRYIYAAKDGRDIIFDEDGDGRIEWDKTVVTGGKSKNPDDLVWYDDPDDARFTYQASDDPDEGPVTLIITSREGGLIEIQEFRNHDLGITLTPGSGDDDQPGDLPPDGPTDLPPPPDPAGAPIPPRRDPLVLDLDGLGIGTLGLGAGLHFDHDADGFAELTGWVGAGDGVLVLDLNEDGRLSNGQELFGDFTRLAGGQLAVNGFAALSAHDRDGDGAITALDPIWSSLRVGSFDTEAGRLLLADPSTGLTLVSLEELGLTSLGLGSAIVNETDAQGNTRSRTGSFERADGTTQELAEYRFARDPMRAVPVDAPVVSEAVAALPQLTGGAKVLRLREALELDSRPEGYLGGPSGALRAKLDAFMAETDASAFYARFEDLLAAWTGVDGIPAGQLRGEIPARHIAILEKFYGQTLAPNPHHWQTLLWEKNYQDLAETLYGDLLAQTHFAAQYAAVERVPQDGGTFFGNLMPLVAGFEAAIAADAVAGQALLDEFGRSLRGRRLTQNTNYFAFREHFVTDAAGALDEDRAFAFDSRGKPVVLFTPDTPANARRLDDYTEAARALDGQGLWANGGDDVLYGDGASTGITGGVYDNVLYGGGGEDWISPDAGNDIVDGGAGNDYIYGSAGDDSYLFRPGGGHDRLAGEAGGFDVIFFGGGLTRNDISFEPDFRGAIVARILATGETFALPAAHIGLEQVVFSGIERFIFSDGSVYSAAQMLVPTPAPDTLLGTTGNDRIDGLAGDDRIVGYDGDDVLLGGAGDDLILAGSGDDLLDGGAGNDRFDASEYLQVPGWWSGWNDNDNDTYRFGYGDGQDIINEISGTDTVLFKPGVSVEDVTLVNEGEDLVIRLAGSSDHITVKGHYTTLDRVSGGSIERLQFADGTVLGAEVLASATIAGTDEQDTLRAYSNANTRILGLAGDDLLTGGDLDDRLEGGEGDDWLIGGKGDDHLLGGEGNDRIEDGGDFRGSESNTLDGGAGDDLLRSGLGDDVLLGGEGNDELEGGHGSDVYIGGAGDDILREVFQPSSYTLGADVFIFGRGDGHDRIIAADVTYGWWNWLRGPQGEEPTGFVRVDDVLRFREGVAPGDITVFGERFFDEANVSSQANVRFEIAGDPDASITVEGFMGQVAGRRWFTSSVRRIEFADGTVWTVEDVLDRLVWQGTEADDDIGAGTLRDVIYGEGGNDHLMGYGGNDRIYGGPGDDYIDSGEGDDLVEGGEGNDRILIGGGGNDLIDPGAGDDFIGWSPLILQSGSLRLRPGVLAGDTTIAFGAGYGHDTVLLANSRPGSNDTVRLAGLTSADVKLLRRDNALVVSLMGTGDSLTVEGWFSNYFDPWTGQVVEHPYRVENLEFADGTTWGAERMLAEVLIGTDESDQLLGYASDDLIEGHGGADQLFGGEGDDVLDGGAGSDFLHDSGGADTVRFGLGDGIDTYQRTNDDLTDTIEFKAGVSTTDVTVRRFEGNYEFGLGDGSDYLYVNSPAPLQARFADGTVWSFEEIKSRSLIGGEFSDTLIGFDGRDDRLEGRGSVDFLEGGSGNDTYVYNDGDSTDFIFDTAGELDTLVFGEGITLDDVFFDSSGNDLLLHVGEGGGLVWVTRGLAEHADGAMPNALERIEFADGTVLSRDAILARVDRVLAPDAIFGTENDDRLQGNDLDNHIFGLEGDDQLEGGAGDDTLEGSSGDDRLEGDDGHDVLLGGDGNDALNGGPGNDVLQGGAGMDTYALWWGGGLDVILDEFSSAGGGFRRDRFPEAYDQALEDLADVLTFGGEGIYFSSSSVWAIQVDGGWAYEIPFELVRPLINFRNGVPAQEAEQAVRALLEWLEGPASRADLFPEVAQTLADELTTLQEQEYGPEDWYWTDVWDELYEDGELDGIPGSMVEALEQMGGSDSEGASVEDWLSVLMELDAWLGSGSSESDVLEVDAYLEEIEVQVTGNWVAIGLIDSDDAVLIRPLQDEGSAGDLPQIAVQRFVFWDGTELTLEEIVDLADGGVIGLQQDFEGSSFLVGSVVQDEIYGNDGDDDIAARGAADFVDGGEGDDRIDAGAGDDEVLGGAGDDVIAGGWGEDYLAGGEGDDVYVYNAFEGDDFIDSASATGTGIDTLSLGADVTADLIWLHINGQDLEIWVDNGLVRVAWFDEQGMELASRELRRLQFVDADGAVAVYDLEAIVKANLAAIGADYIWLMDLDLEAAQLGAPVAGGSSAVAYAQTADLFGEAYFAGNQPTEGADQLVGSDEGEEIDAGSGDDRVSAGAGDDLVWGGEGDDVLSGGRGDDILAGGTGDDLAHGGAGHDTYLYARGDGRLTIEDSGANTIEFAGDISFEELTLSYEGEFLHIGLQSEGDLVRLAGFQPADPFGSTAVSSFYFEAEDPTCDLAELFAKGFDFAGTESADYLPGTFLVDRIVAGEGADAIRGAAGDDVLDGGLGADTYYFEIGDGHDLLIDRESEIDRNTLVFGAGITAQTLEAFAAGGSLYLAYGPLGEDLIQMPDTVLGDIERPFAFDEMRFADATSLSFAELLDRGLSITGTPQADRLVGARGADSIWGLAGDDLMLGGAGADVYYVGAGSGVDTIEDVSSPGEQNALVLSVEGLQAQDLVLSHDEEAGTLDIDLGAGNRVKLAGFDPQEPFGDRAVDRIELFDGTSLSYEALLALGLTIQGTADNDLLTGTVLRDYIHGGEGDDYLEAGPGGGIAYGGAGDDAYAYDRGDGELRIVDEPSATPGNRVLFGAGIALADFRNNLRFLAPSAGAPGELIIDLGAGDVLRIEGFDPQDAEHGTHGVQTFVFADGRSVDYTELVRSTFIVQGDTGDDALSGTNIADRLYGFEANDELRSGAGMDTLTGGTGDDLLEGGADGDMYVFNRGDGIDVIREDGNAFDENLVVFGPGIGVADLSFELANGMLRIGYGPGDEVRIEGIDPAAPAIREIRLDDGTVLPIGAALNGAPQAGQALADLAVQEGTAFELTLPAGAFSDPDGETLSFAASRANGFALPSWLAFDAATGTLSGTAQNPDVGSYAITVSATDAYGLSASQSFVLTVANVNDAPVVANELPDLLAGEDEAFVFTVPAGTFADVDAGDVLTLTASLADGSALPQWLAFDAEAGALSGTPSNADVGVLQLRVAATDSSGASVSEDFALAVTNANDVPAVANAIADQALTQDVAFSFSVPADTFADADLGDSLAYFALLADGNPLPAWLEFDPSSLTFSGVPASDNVGIVTLNLIAVDSLGAAASTAFKLSVANVNDAPIVASPLPDRFVVEDEAFSWIIPAAAFWDADPGDALSITVHRADGAAMPAWLDFDEATGTLSGTPGNAEVGVTSLRITATDLAGETAHAPILLVVSNVNDAPFLASPIGDQQATAGDAFDFTVPPGTFVDIDAGDTLILSATLADGSPLPAWLGLEAASGTFTGTPGSADVGAYTIRLTATDAAGASASDLFDVAVEDTAGTGQTIIGTSGNDVLEGTPFNDFLDGRRGADRLNARAGDDLLQFHADDEWGLLSFAVHLGSPGVRGTAEVAWLAGKNRSNDTFDGGEGFDTLLGTDGHDVLALRSWLDGHGEARIAGIESIAMGAGNDIVDLTSLQYAYGDVVIDGGAGDDTLWASSGDDVLSGGRGDDRLSGGAGSDVYLYGFGDGHDVIREAGKPGSADILRFGAGISADRVTARRHHDDLVLRVTGSEGSVTVRNWFSSSAQRVERIEFADGKSWNEARIRELCSFAVHHHPDHHEPHQGRPDEKRDRYHEDRHGDDRHGASPAKGHDAVSDLIAQRLSLVPRFDFESLLEHLERPTERVLPAEEIARRWQAVAAYASALAAEHDESDEEAATPPGWSKPRVGSAAGWGFEGSVGTRSAPEFETLSGLTEGFRNLGGL